jgi:hypothetical protein
MTDHDTAKLSPQQRGAQRRKEARLGVVVRPTVHAEEPAAPSEHVLLRFRAEDEADVLVVSRALRSVGREHSVLVTPTGYTLSRQV